MVSTTSFERINGHAPYVLPDSDTALFRATCDCDCGATVVRVIGGWRRSETLALGALVDAVLDEHKSIARAKAQWKCQQCGSVAGLEVHHMVFRSSDRNDRVSNLIALCNGCHRREHGQ